MAGEIGLAVGEIGVAEAVVDVGGIRIGNNVELEEFDGGFDFAGLEIFVAHAIHKRFGEEDVSGMVVAAHDENLGGLGGVAGLVDVIEKAVLVLSEDRSEDGGNGGVRAEGVGEPGDDVGGKILVQVEEFDTVAAFGEMFKLVHGVGGEAVDPLHVFDDPGIGIVIGDGGEKR